MIECLLIKKSSNRRLTLEERKTIEKMLHSKRLHKEICEILNIAPSTLYRDFKKCQNEYNAEEAHRNNGRSSQRIDWDFVGKRFGLVTVIEFANIYKKRSWWKCRCDCGKECILSRKKLLDYCSDRRPFSCGCIAKQWGGRNNQLPIEELALRKYQDLIKFRKINRECWEWTGYYQKGKCPKTSWRNKAMTVRKCMYLLMNGITYEPNPIFTTCGNLRCFNPEHLTLQRPVKRHFFEETYE